MTLHRWVLGLSLGMVSCTAAPLRSSLTVRTSAPSVLDATSRAQAQPTAVAYELLTPKQTGVRQVFDDAHDTYLQFQGAVPAGLLLFDEDGQALSYKRIASAVVTSGLHSGLLLVRTPTSSSYAQAPCASRSIASKAMRAEEGGAGADLERRGEPARGVCRALPNV